MSSGPSNIVPFDGIHGPFDGQDDEICRPSCGDTGLTSSRLVIDFDPRISKNQGTARIALRFHAESGSQDGDGGERSGH